MPQLSLNENCNLTGAEGGGAMRWPIVLFFAVALGCLSCTGDTGPMGPPGSVVVFYDQFDAETIVSPWTSSGDVPWFTKASAWSLYGPRIAQSGDLDDNQTSTLSITGDYTEPGLVVFIGSVESEAGGDWFRWTLDGGSVDAVSGSGEMGGMLRVTGSFPVPAGHHTIEWSYEKNEAVSVGTDRGVLHAVMIINHDSATLPLPTAEVQEGGVVWSDFGEVAAGTVR